MAVTAPASLSKIVAEFGGPNNLSAYVRGGTYVPAYNTGVSATTAGLSINSFVDASDYSVISLTNIEVNQFNFTISTDGSVTGGTWATPIQTNASYGLEYVITNYTTDGDVTGPGNSSGNFTSNLSWALISEGNVSVQFTFALRRLMPDDGDGPYYIEYGSAVYRAWAVS